MVPKRTSASEYAKSYLYQEYNEISFFIEDTCSISKKIILEIIQRIFNNTIKINNIFSLGGKEKVLEKYDNRDLDKKQIFIVDGDLDLFYKEYTVQEGLLVLDRYCIENYLLDYDAIENLLYEECHNENDMEKVCREFKLSNWIKYQEELLSELFILYAIVKKYDLSIETVSYSVYRLINHSKSKCDVDDELIKKRLNELESKILEKIKSEELEEIRCNFREKLKAENNIAIRYLSVKDYILPPLLLKIRHFSDSNSLDKSLKYRLARKCDITELKSLFNHQYTLVS